MHTAPTVVITTAGPLGRAIAALLITKGARVAIYHTELMRPHAEMLVRELGADHIHAQPIDLDRWDTFRAAVAATTATFSAPSHAVVAFDRWGGGGPLHVGGWQDNGLYDRVTMTNTEAVYRAMRVLLPVMVQQRSGSFVLLGSRVERLADNAGAAIYVASKAAALSLVQTAAEEVREHGVRVNAIMLSVVDDAAARAELPGFDRSRWVAPEEVASTVAFLISEEARAVTGAMIPMYGRT